jgi:hypothetical protein
VKMCESPFKAMHAFKAIMLALWCIVLQESHTSDLTAPCGPEIMFQFFYHKS